MCPSVCASVKAQLTYLNMLLLSRPFWRKKPDIAAFACLELSSYQTASASCFLVSLSWVEDCSTEICFLRLSLARVTSKLEYKNVYEENCNKKMLSSIYVHLHKQLRHQRIVRKKVIISFWDPFNKYGDHPGVNFKIIFSPNHDSSGRGWEFRSQFILHARFFLGDGDRYWMGLKIMCAARSVSE